MKHHQPTVVECDRCGSKTESGHLCASVTGPNIAPSGWIGDWDLCPQCTSELMFWMAKKPAKEAV